MSQAAMARCAGPVRSTDPADAMTDALVDTRPF
jgi:hypothetical protein